MSAPYAEQKPGAPPAYGQPPYYQQPPPMAQPMYMGTAFGDMPVRCNCIQCQQLIVTRVEKKNGLLPWLLCGGIALFGFIFGCCLVPFCIDSIKDTYHYCPSCGAVLGSHKHM